MSFNYTWYTNKNTVGTPDAIHQILAYGRLEDIRDLEKNLGLEKIRNIFIMRPKKIYTQSGLNFISEFILHISSPLNKNEYLKTTPRFTR